MTNLKPVNIGFNQYCGPAVLSILTGKTTDDCVDAIRRVYPEYGGAEVPYGKLLAAAERLGFDCIQAQTGVSLYGTIVRLAKLDGIYIILVPHHVVTIEVINRVAYFCDNKTKEPIPASSSARLGQRVLAAHRVVKRPEPVFIRRMITARINMHMKQILILHENVFDTHSDTTVLGSIKIKDVDDARKVAEAIGAAIADEVSRQPDNDEVVL